MKFMRLPNAAIKDKNVTVRCDYIKSVSNCRERCGERAKEKYGSVCGR